MMSTHWFDHVLFAFIGIILPWMSFQSKLHQDEEGLALEIPSKKQLYYNNFFLLLIGMLICLTAWNAGKNDWEMLGIAKMEKSFIALVAMILLVLFYLFDGLFTLKSQKTSISYFERMKDIIPLTWNEYISFIPLAIMAGIGEEIIFRAYLYQYLLTFFPDIVWGPYLAIGITAIGFSLGHLYQGWIAVVKIFVIAMLFGLIYVHSKSLIAVVTIHVMIDIFSGMSGIWMNKKLNAKDSTL
ncbi:MAG: CPBP family intramembrane glutamic endopeptidase [Saprospiraceae bacterium]